MRKEMSRSAGWDADWCELVQGAHGQRPVRTRLLGRVQDLLEVLQRHLRLAVEADHGAHLLQRPEDEERVDPQGEELTHRDLLREDQVQHQEEDARAQRVDRRALDEAQAAQVAYLLQLQAQDLLRRAVQAAHLLLGQPHALDQLDVPERFRGGAGQGGRLGHDDLLDGLDAAGEGGAEPAQERHGQEVDGSDDPVDGEGVDRHEHDAHQGGEHGVDGRGDELFHVRADLLQLAQRLAAALVLEHRVGQLQGVADAVRVDLRPQALRDHVDEVVLEVLGHARDEGHAHRRRQQQAHAGEELSGRVLPEPHGIAVDHVTKDERIEQGEDLVERGQEQGQGQEPAIAAQVRPEEPHAWGIVVRACVAPTFSA
jgi:hypothetical protein